MTVICGALVGWLGSTSVCVEKVLGCRSGYFGVWSRGLFKLVDDGDAQCLDNRVSGSVGRAGDGLGGPELDAEYRLHRAIRGASKGLLRERRAHRQRVAIRINCPGNPRFTRPS